MAYVLDIILAAVIIICIIRGAKKGFIRAAFSILTFFMAALLSFMFYGQFSDYVISTPPGQNMTQSLRESVYKAVSGDTAAQSQNAEASAPDGEERQSSQQQNGENDVVKYNTTEEILNSMKLPQFIFGSVMSKSDFLMRNARITAAEAVSEALSEALMKILAGIVLFVLILIALWLLKILLEFVFRLPLLKEVNSLAGCVAGLINGLLVSYLIMAAVSSLAGFPELQFIRDSAQSSYIYKNLYETNMILEMFTK